MCKGFNSHFSRKDIQIPNKHIKRCSTSLAVRAMQNKTTIHYHFTSSRMAKIKMTDNTMLQQECGEIGTLTHCWQKTLENSLTSPQNVKYSHFTLRYTSKRNEDISTQKLVNKDSQQHYFQQSKSRNNAYAYHLVNKFLMWYMHTIKYYLA